MLNRGSRIIKLKKKDLQKAILKNKANHISSYKKAVIAYKAEALKQLEELTKDAENGVLDLKLKLIKPIDNSSNYDKIHEMFAWETRALIELTQDEFNEYVLDDNAFTRDAMFANTSYLR